MKRFYKDVSVAETDLGWTVHLDGRPIKTQGGQPQVLPSEAMAEMLAAEWRAQGEKIDPASFRFRDMADYALDVVARDAESVVDKLVGYAETDTLCYRADPEEALYRHQQETWDPLVEHIEDRFGVRFFVLDIVRCHDDIKQVVDFEQPKAPFDDRSAFRCDDAHLVPFCMKAI